MKLINETSLMMIYLDDSSQCMYNVFQTPDFLEKETIKSEIKNLAEKIIEHRPKMVLSNDQKRQFIYDVALQNEIAQILVEACIKTGVEKYAIINPEGLVESISAEQVAAEDVVIASGVEVAFFLEEPAAKRWLGLA